MGNAASYCATVADLHMSDVLYDLNQQRMLLFHQEGSFYLSLAHRCSYCQVTVFCFDVVQFRNMVNVYNVCWPGQAHIKQGDQALSPCQHFCVFSIVVEQRERFVQHVRSAIAKSWWFHYSPPSYNTDRYCICL